jgi:hypothetical protein
LIPLLFACKQGHLRTAQWLVASGAEGDVRGGVPVFTDTGEPTTPLVAAASIEVRGVARAPRRCNSKDSGKDKGNNSGTGKGKGNDNDGKYGRSDQLKTTYSNANAFQPIPPSLRCAWGQSTEMSAQCRRAEKLSCALCVKGPCGFELEL